VIRYSPLIKAVLFDLDQTLIDFMKMKKLCCEEAIDAMIDAGLKVKKEKAMKMLFNLYKNHGIEDQTIFQKFLKKVTGSVDYRILSHAILAYRKVRNRFLMPYPKVKYVLNKLRKERKLAIVSDAPKLQAWLRLSTMNIDKYFDVVVALEDIGKIKPSPLPFKAALRKLKVKADECLMVGDYPQRDILGAKRLGMQTCLAKYGQVKKGNVKADFEIDSIEELLEVL